MKEAIRTAIDTQRAQAKQLEERLRIRMEGEGIEFVDLTDQERTAFFEASAPAIATAHRSVSAELIELAGS